MESLGYKQIYDEYYVAFDFVNVIATTDTIVLATIIVMEGLVEKTTDLTTVANQNISGSDVNVWIKGGVSGHVYIFTCKIVTNNGEKFEMDAELLVLDE